jgi:hypothetical protein
LDIDQRNARCEHGATIAHADSFDGRATRLIKSDDRSIVAPRIARIARRLLRDAPGDSNRNQHQS